MLILIPDAVYGQIEAAFAEANEARDKVAENAIALLVVAFGNTELTSTMFQRLGYNFTSAFTKAFDGATGAAKIIMNDRVKTFYADIMAQSNSTDILQAVQSTDFTDMNSIDMLANQMDELGYSTDEARDKVYDLAASLNAVDFSKGILSANEMMEEYGNTLGVLSVLTVS